MKYFDRELLSGYNLPMFWQRTKGMSWEKVEPSAKHLIDLGRNTTEADIKQEKTFVREFEQKKIK